MPARKGEQESLLMGKKGLSGASQSKSISVFSPFYIVGSSQTEQSSMPGGVAVLGRWCRQSDACLLEVFSPRGSSSSAGCCVQITDISLSLSKSRGSCGFGSECFLTPARSGKLSNCSRHSADGNRPLLQPLVMQTCQ